MEVDLTKYAPELVKDARARMGELLAGGYDTPAAHRFAKAEKSWCDRASRDWFLWEIVILLTRME